MTTEVGEEGGGGGGGDGIHSRLTSQGVQHSVHPDGHPSRCYPVQQDLITMVNRWELVFSFGLIMCHISMHLLLTEILNNKLFLELPHVGTLSTQAHFLITCSVPIVQLTEFTLTV